MPAQRKYPAELRERAVQMVEEIRDREGKGHGEIARVGRQLGIHPEAVRTWMRQREIDGGQRPGTTTADSVRIAELERENRELRRANDTEGGECVFREGTRPRASALVGFIDSHRDRFGVEPACAVLEFPVSTYYAARRRQREPSPRARRDEELKKEILRVWQGRRKGREVYGARKVWRQLRRDGIGAARCTVERLMGELGIRGASARARRPRTTVPGTVGSRPADLLGRDFGASAPNTRWVADITYVGTARGFACAAFVTDLFARKIVGWQVADHLRADLALDALEMAIWSRRQHIAGDLVHHSDRGVQYTSIHYTQRLEDIKAVRSVGSKGDSYDNAAAESVNSLYKKELINIEGPWQDAGDVTVATAEWVHWYNNDRLHSWCGNVPPAEHENTWLMNDHADTIKIEAQAS